MRRLKAMFKKDTKAKATSKKEKSTQEYLQDLYDSMARSQLGRPSLNPQLCAYCQNICQHWPTQRGAEGIMFFPYYGTKKDLLISAKTCALCDRIAAGGFTDTILSSHPFLHSWTEEESPWRWGSKYNPAGSEWRFKVGFVEIMRMGRGGGRCGGWTGTPRECPEQGTITAYIPPDENHQSLQPSTPDGSFLEAKALVPLVPSAYQDLAAVGEKPPFNTKDGLSRARLWLDVCQTSDEHHLCINPVSDFIPTRLLDLEGPEPRLRLTKDIPNLWSCWKLKRSTIPYATLSHCWGPPPITHLTLTTQNLDQLLLGIPNASLSKTFGDSILVARYLGLQYIWIDSLCIIQDDEEDWRKEASQMSDVYRYSSINITASGAADGTVGLFFDRNHPARVRISTPSDQWYVMALNQGQKQLESMPLMSRAWCLQERILPARTLHFTPTQIFWECNTLHACEAAPHHKGPNALYPGIPGGKAQLQSHSESTTRVRSHLDHWYIKIVTPYSACSLTFGKDKLVAIGGLAKLSQELTGYQYVAGMWKEDLETQLCWAVEKATKPRPTPYRAPSWSWAALDDVFKTPVDEQYLNYVKQQSIQCHNLPVGDPFGQVLSANLRLTCDHLFVVDSIASIEKVHFSWDPYVFTVHGAPLICDYKPDSITEQGSEICKSPVGIFLLPIQYRQLVSYAYMLVLQPTHEKRGQYRRLGRVGYSNSNTPKDRNVLEPSGRGPVNDTLFAEIFTNEDSEVCRVIELV